MALIERGMYKLLLRVHVRQEIDPYAWKYLLESCSEPATDWDGELFLFQAMNPWDMESISEELLSFGYRWTKDLKNADFAWFAFELPQLDWLERVTATPLKKKLDLVHVWQMKGSNVGWFRDHSGIKRYRGEDYQW